LTHCRDYTQGKIAAALQRHFELLGGLDKFIKRGDSVLIKPNLIAPRSHRYATQTHPSVILETARLVKDFGAKPFVGDSPAWSNAVTCIKALRVDGDLKKLGVEVRQLDSPRKCKIGDGMEVGISEAALEADAIINLPKFKSHQQLVATFAVKNMFGCVSGKKKAWWHFAKGGCEGEFCKMLIEIYRYLHPVFTIIDGVIAMDGAGPIRGRSRGLGYIIGGVEPFACEAVCSQLINLNPDELPIVRTAKKLGIDCPDFEKIKILGDAFPENVCTDFQMPQMIPIRFSLTHVAKSVCKQVVLLAKSAMGRKSSNGGGES
jgi:uncharacterized protein (DUF362 family)